MWREEKSGICSPLSQSKPLSICSNKASFYASEIGVIVAILEFRPQSGTMAKKPNQQLFVHTIILQGWVSSVRFQF